MKLVRWILGRLILLLNAVFSPRSVQRPVDEQQKIDDQTRHLVLYQYEACPFCVKVRRSMKRLNLKIELRDSKRVPQYAEELVKGGGEMKVPCLRIVSEDAKEQWMYESSDIVAYLESRFAA
ncbi:MAG: glutathione S-transferase N-terminal domain-containing protein [Gammaproteobacteria bacterium]|nr:glutathione S-transferase N-terminal domain-containing protein [Gammaproteobacteria bacterium]